MFGIGSTELVFILVIVLILFGPKKIPQLAKSLGKGLSEFKRASREVREQMENAAEDFSVLKEQNFLSPHLTNGQEEQGSEKSTTVNAAEETDEPGADPAAQEIGKKNHDETTA